MDDIHITISDENGSDVEERNISVHSETESSPESSSQLNHQNSVEIKHTQINQEISPDTTQLNEEIPTVNARHISAQTEISQSENPHTIHPTIYTSTNTTVKGQNTFIRSNTIQTPPLHPTKYMNSPSFKRTSRSTGPSHGESKLYRKKSSEERAKQATRYTFANYRQECRTEIHEDWQDAIAETFKGEFPTSKSRAYTRIIVSLSCLGLFEAACIVCWILFDIVRDYVPLEGFIAIVVGIAIIPPLIICTCAREQSVPPSHIPRTLELASPNVSKKRLTGPLRNTRVTKRISKLPNGIRTVRDIWDASIHQWRLRPCIAFRPIEKRIIQRVITGSENTSTFTRVTENQTNNRLVSVPTSVSFAASMSPHGHETQTHVQSDHDKSSPLASHSHMVDPIHTGITSPGTKRHANNSLHTSTHRSNTITEDTRKMTIMSSEFTRLTYIDVHEKIKAAGAGLHAKLNYIAAATRELDTRNIGILTSQKLEWAFAAMGCLRYNMPIVALTPSLTLAELSCALTVTDTSIIICDSQHITGIIALLEQRSVEQSQRTSNTDRTSTDSLNISGHKSPCDTSSKRVFSESFHSRDTNRDLNDVLHAVVYVGLEPSHEQLAKLDEARIDVSSWEALLNLGMRHPVQDDGLGQHAQQYKIGHTGVNRWPSFNKGHIPSNQMNVPSMLPTEELSSYMQNSESQLLNSKHTDNMNQSNYVKMVSTDSGLDSSSIYSVCDSDENNSYDSDTEVEVTTNSPNSKTLHEHTNHYPSKINLSGTSKSNIQTNSTIPTVQSIAMIAFTSQADGGGWGVQLSHGHLVAAVAGVEHGMPPLTSMDTYMACLPPSNIREFIYQIVMFRAGACIGFTTWDPSIRSNTIVQGLTNTFYHRLSIHDDSMTAFIDACQFRPTIFLAPPYLLQSITKYAKGFIESKNIIQRFMYSYGLKRKRIGLARGVDSPFWNALLFDSLRTQLLGGRTRIIVSSGANLASTTQVLLSSILCCPILSSYGRTDTCGIIGISWPDAKAQTGLVGPPIGTCDIQLRAHSRFPTGLRNSMPFGVLHVRGANVSSEYYSLSCNDSIGRANLPYHAKRQNARKKSRPWLNTGDMVSITIEGNICVAGAQSDVIILSDGSVINPSYLESIFSCSPYVRHVFVSAAVNADAIVAIVVPDIWRIQMDPTLKHIKNTLDATSSTVLQSKVQESFVQLVTMNRLQNGAIPKIVFLVSDEWSATNGSLTTQLELKRATLFQRYASILGGLNRSPTRHRSGGTKAAAISGISTSYK